jgi:plastocyanin
MKKSLAILLLGIGLSFAAQAAESVVDFHIAAGTGTAPWNTLANPIVVKIGQTLRFHNDDSIAHELHTAGSPCPHGTRAFNPGETYDCVISSAHEAGEADIWDHIQGSDAMIYIQAD